MNDIADMHRAIMSLGIAIVLFLGASNAIAADGAALYREHCAACHGNAGGGGLGVPLALVDLLAVADDEYFRRTIRLGRPGRHMPGFPELSNRDVDAIIAHLRGWAPRVRPKQIEVAAGDALRGEALYQRWCSVCHGLRGEGEPSTGITWSWDGRRTVAAPALNNPGFLQAASDAMIKRTLIRGRRGTAMPSFRTSELDSDDLDDIIAYIRSLPAQTEETAPVYRQSRLGAFE